MTSKYPKYATWYYDEMGYYWFPNGYKPDGSGCHYLCEDEEFTDPFGIMILHADEDNYVPNGTSDGINLTNSLIARYTRMFGVMRVTGFLQTYPVLAVIAFNTDPGLGLNYKGMESAPFGSGADKHTYVGGWILRNQDWGNYLFSWSARQLGFHLFEILKGAGLAQIWKHTSSWNFWNSNFDDPVDQFWIKEGYYNQLMLPLNERE